MKVRGYLAVPTQTATWWRGGAGVRAGWRVGLFVAGLVVGVLLLSLVWHFARAGLHPYLAHMVMLSPSGIALQECLLLLPLTGATLGMAYLEGAAWPGFLSVRNLAMAPLGVVMGLVAVAVLMALLSLSGLGIIQPGGLGIRSAWHFALAWAVSCSLTGLVEELLFRGYLLQALARGLGFWPAAVLSSLLFAAGHAPNGGETFLGLANVIAAGMLFCWGINRTGTLWWAIGFHAAWDFSENYLFGTFDSGYRLPGGLYHTSPFGPAMLSGGNAGPEGSVFCVLVLAAAALTVARLTAQNSGPSAAR